MPRTTFLFFTFLILLPLALRSFGLPPLPSFVFGYVGPEVTESKFLFVGDIMLARYVETLIAEKGREYPFVGLSPLQDRYDAVIGNFEASIPVEHTKTLTSSMKFSVATSSLESLPDYFDIVSLANNHTFDSEQEGLENTHKQLEQIGVQPFADPQAINEESVTYVLHGEKNIALIGLNAVGGLDIASATALVREMQSRSEMQIVYIHWGNEYELVHSPEQEVIATALIDSGADAIIGHHPHVIQDIGLYKGAPIFYSLGNFVFDQYFDEHVTVGLGVELVLKNSSVSYHLVPFTAGEYKSSPRLMTYSERTELFSEIAAKSSPAIAAQLNQNGTIVISQTLASL